MPTVYSAAHSPTTVTTRAAVIQQIGTATWASGTDLTTNEGLRSAPTTSIDLPATRSHRGGRPQVRTHTPSIWPNLGHMVTDEIGTFVGPDRVFSRDGVLSRPSPVPSKDGVYGWWFRRLSAATCGSQPAAAVVTRTLRCCTQGSALTARRRTEDLPASKPSRSGSDTTTRAMRKVQRCAKHPRLSTYQGTRDRTSTGGDW